MIDRVNFFLIVENSNNRQQTNNRGTLHLIDLIGLWAENIMVIFGGFSVDVRLRPKEAKSDLTFNFVLSKRQQQELKNNVRSFR